MGESWTKARQFSRERREHVFLPACENASRLRAVRRVGTPDRAGLIMHGTGHAGRGGPHFKLGARTSGRPRGCEAGVLSGRAGVTETDVINQEPHF